MIETQRGVHNASAIANQGHRLRADRHGDLAISLGGFPTWTTPRAGLQDRARRLQGRERPCGIFTLSAEAAAKRRNEGYAL